MNYAKNFRRMRKGFDLPQALAEANRCLLCHDAPCSTECPADTKQLSYPGIGPRNGRPSLVPGRSPA